MQEIICVLDQSGSMASIADDAKGGFNQFLRDQKAIGEAGLTIAWFDDKWRIGYTGSLSDAKELNSWPAVGMTALYDGIAKTMNFVAQRFEREKPEKVILAILTDGQENSSKEFDKTSIARMIKEHQEKYGWEVIFLAADQDAFSVASQLNIMAANTFNYSSNDTKAGFATYSSAVARSRIS